MPWFAPATASEAQLQAGIDLLAPVLDAVNDGVIADITITKPMTLPAGLKANPNANSEVQKGALLDFSVLLTTRGFGLWVPAWLPAQFAADVPITTPASLGEAFINAYLAGDDSTWEPTNEYGLALNAFRSGEKRFRK
jgi:hypothetical protein